MSARRSAAGQRAVRPGSIEQTLISQLARHGELTREQLAAYTDRSRSALAPVISALRDDGLLIEREAVTTAGRGRNPRRLALTSEYGLTVGVTFGHAEMRSAAAELTGHVLDEQHVSLAVDDSPTTSLDHAAEAISRFTDRYSGAKGDLRIVVGLPCPIDTVSGRILTNNILPGWGQINPAQELHGRTGYSAILENDANLAALGEHSHGAGRSFRDFLYLRASAGIGIGIILDGRLHRGGHGIAGEIGHTSTGDSQELCRCGNRGCLETVAATGAITNALRQIHGPKLTWDDVVELMADNDPSTRRVVSESARATARTLATLCHILDLDGIVAGGDIPDASPHYVNAIRHAVTDYHEQLLTVEPVPVRATQLGTRADLLGAIRAARERPR
jgi:predicted NBD/HSP70 family sugar kinase